MKVVVAAHGRLSEELVKSGRMITEYGEDDFFTLCMTEEKGGESLVAEAREIYERYQEEEFLLLADFFGASPCNSCLLAFRGAKYRMVTGVNLAMIVEVMMNKDISDLESLAKSVEESGKESIVPVYLGEKEE
ncbi:MAG: PTS fructose transporter subunit IIA [Hespellia sp.]|jgi:PTS system mannose-specific IIA component|nr:PTS fructose transporter subunit IIA [Hespellia sp.]